MAVEGFDAVAQVAEVVVGALQAILGADDARVVPEGGAHLVPVLLDEERVRVLGLGRPLPGAEVVRIRRARARGHIGHGGVGGAGAPEQAFQQARGGKAVRAVQARTSHFTRGEEAFEVRAAIQVHEHAAAEVVGRGHDGDGLLQGLDALGPASGEDVGEVGFQIQFLRDRLKVEVSAGFAPLRHFLEDGAAHHIAGRQLHLLRRITRHETLALLVEEDAAFTAQGLGEQLARLARNEQRRRMELHELAVHDARVGAVGGREPVPRGAGRVRRVQVEVAEAAGGEHRARGEEGFHPSRRLVEEVGALHFRRFVDATRIHRVVRAREQIHEAELLAHGDFRMRLHRLAQPLLDGGTRRVLGVVDAARAVGRFRRGRRIAIAIGVEGHAQALPEKGAAETRALLREHPHGFGTAEARAGFEDVLREQRGAVAFLLARQADDAALRPAGVAEAQVVFGNEHHRQALVRRRDRGRATRDATTENEKVRLHQASSVHRGRAMRQRVGQPGSPSSSASRSAVIRAASAKSTAPQGVSTRPWKDSSRASASPHTAFMPFAFWSWRW